MNKLMNFSILSERVYRKIIDAYLIKLSFEKDHPNSFFKGTKLFVTCLPTLKYISKYIKKGKMEVEKNKKNIYFIKICLDIYEDYLKTFDYPLFKKYKNPFLIVAITFYSKLSEEQFKLIHDQVTGPVMRGLSKFEYYNFRNKIL